PKLLQIPAKSAVRFSSSYKKSPNHQVIRTPIFCSPTTVDEEPKKAAGNYVGSLFVCKFKSSNNHCQ
ncbi:hypothetical protein, partial [Lentilactobacillus kefiri]|uniref:hypothetical protein n=1 Tax=Lentilactobacillus kefiri TaxID=33962 RepID=UPI0020746184